VRVAEDHRLEEVSERDVHGCVEFALVEIAVDDSDAKLGLVGPVGVLVHVQPAESASPLVQVFVDVFLDGGVE
jgi:hypothetical protein